MAHQDIPRKLFLNKPLFSHTEIHTVSHGKDTYVITDRIENQMSNIQCRRVKTRDFEIILSWDKSNDKVVNTGQIVSLVAGSSSFIFLAFYIVFNFFQGVSQRTYQVF